MVNYKRVLSKLFSMSCAYNWIASSIYGPSKLDDPYKYVINLFWKQGGIIFVKKNVWMNMWVFHPVQTWQLCFRKKKACEEKRSSTIVVLVLPRSQTYTYVCIRTAYLNYRAQWESLPLLPSHFWEHAACTISHVIAPVQWAMRESFKLGFLQVSSTVRKCWEMECELRTLIFSAGPAAAGRGHGARMLSGAIPLGR